MMAPSSPRDMHETAAVLTTTLPDAATQQEKADFGRGLALLAALIEQLAAMAPNGVAGDGAAR